MNAFRFITIIAAFVVAGSEDLETLVVGAVVVGVMAFFCIEPVSKNDIV